MCFAPQRRALFPHRNFQKWCAHVVFCTFSLRNVLRATTACTFSTSELPKVVQTWGVLYILTSKCAARHNDVSFFDISTSKSGPTMVCFVHFDIEMCFAPQRRALFRHLNCQKWPHLVCFVHFDLQMRFAPQRRALFRHFNCQKWPHLVCFVHFDLQMRFAPQRRAIFHLSSGQLAPHPSLQRAYFSTLLEKQNVSRLSYPFAHLHLLSSDSFTSLIFSLLLSLSSLCLFPALPFICPYCRKFDF